MNISQEIVQIDFSLKPEGTDFQKVCGESYKK